MAETLANCPDCRSSGTYLYIPEIGQEACSHCGAVSQTLQFYEPTTAYELGFSIGAPVSYNGRDHSTYAYGLQAAPPPLRARGRTDLQVLRFRAYLQFKPHVEAFIRLVLARLGYPGCYHRADYLFEHARVTALRLADRLRPPRPKRKRRTRAGATRRSASSDDGEKEAADHDLEEHIRHGDSSDTDAEDVLFSDEAQDVNADLRDHSLENGNAAIEIQTASSTEMYDLGMANPIRWGARAMSMAAACCFAVLRREGINVDLATVANAAEMRLYRLRHCFLRLKRLLGDQSLDISLKHPDTYLRGILMWLLLHLRRDGGVSLGSRVALFLQPLLRHIASSDTYTCHGHGRTWHRDTALVNTPLERVEEIALDLSAWWWPQRSVVACDPRLSAFAAIIAALETYMGSEAPRQQLFLHSHRALHFSWVIDDPELALDDTLFIENVTRSQNLEERYAEIWCAIDRVAQRIPWIVVGVSDTELLPRNQKKRLGAAAASPSASGSRRGKQVAAKERTGLRAPDWQSRLVCRHSDLITNLPEILQFAKRTLLRTSPNVRTDDDVSRDDQSLGAPSGLVPRPDSASRAVSIDTAEAHVDHIEDIENSEVDRAIASAARTRNSLDALASALQVLDEERIISSEAGGAAPSQPVSSEEATQVGEVYPRLRQQIEAAVAATALDDRTRRDKFEESDDEQRSTQAAHPLDLLTDEQVDTLLFEPDELASMVRSDLAERRSLLQAKQLAGLWQEPTENSEHDFWCTENTWANALADVSPVTRRPQHDAPTPSIASSMVEDPSAGMSPVPPGNIRKRRTSRARQKADRQPRLGREKKEEPEPEPEPEPGRKGVHKPAAGRTKRRSSSAAQPAPSQSQRRRLTTAKVVAPISLDQQQEESDWSDAS